MGKKSMKSPSKSPMKSSSKKDDTYPEDIEEYYTNAYEESSSNIVTEETPSETRAEEVKSSSFDIGEAIELLTEKKLNSREPVLTSIVNHLRSSGSSAAEFNHLDEHFETLLTILTRMLRRPSSVKEGTIICNILALMALYMGPHDLTVLNTSERIFLQLIDRSEPELNDLRCYALFAYCFIIYVYEMEEKLVQVLDFLVLIMNGISPEASSPRSGGGVVSYTSEVKAKAMDCFVLLGSHLEENELLERIKDGDLFETIYTLMDSAGNDIQTKVAAGRAIAFFFETAHNTNPESSFEEIGYLICHNPRIVDDALDVIRSICTDSSKKVSKKNRKEQRAEFRDIENWILEREYPTETIRMQGAEIEISSFAKERVIESLKAVLESGFHSSLRMYPVVKEILGVEFLTDDMDGGGGNSKVTKGSSADKMRTKHMRQDRQFRHATLHDDGNFSD